MVTVNLHSKPLIVLLIICSIGVVFAFGGSEPEIMGHSAGEVLLNFEGDDYTLQEAIDLELFSGSSGSGPSGDGVQCVNWQSSSDTATDPSDENPISLIVDGENICEDENGCEVTMSIFSADSEQFFGTTDQFALFQFESGVWHTSVMGDIFTGYHDQNQIGPKDFMGGIAVKPDDTGIFGGSIPLYVESASKGSLANCALYDDASEPDLSLGDPLGKNQIYAEKRDVPFKGGNEYCVIKICD